MALAFSNTPAAITLPEGTRALSRTNPIACACPAKETEPLVIDLSLSKVAHGRVRLAARECSAIPDGWALDVAGAPTTDLEAALEGAILPMGDGKGAALVLMVRMLAAGVAGATFGHEASSFFLDGGTPPGIGHPVLLMNRDAFAPGFTTRSVALRPAILVQQSTRLPTGQPGLNFKDLAQDYRHRLLEQREFLMIS